MKHPRFNATHMCRICGYQPKHNLLDEPTSQPTLYWDADDGWLIGHLCRPCWEDNKDAAPKPDDYAYSRRGLMPEVETDEDPITAL